MNRTVVRVAPLPKHCGSKISSLTPLWHKTDAPYYGSCSEKLNLSTTVYSSIFRLLKPIPLLWGLKCLHSHHTKHHVLNFPSTYISIPFIFSYLLYLYHSTSLDTVPLYLYRTLISLHRTHFSWIVLICKVFLLNFSLCITAVLFTWFIYLVSTRTRSCILYFPYLYGVHHNVSKPSNFLSISSKFLHQHATHSLHAALIFTFEIQSVKKIFYSSKFRARSALKGLLGWINPFTRLKCI